jgi:hypothetical protein
LNQMIPGGSASSLYERTGDRFAQPDLRTAKYRVDGEGYRI